MTINSQLGEKLFTLIPKIKGPVQLAAFLFVSLCLALVYRIDPNNLRAIGITGALGLALIAMALLFNASILKMIPKQQIAYFILTVIVLFLGSLIGLALYTSNAINKVSPKHSLFDVRSTEKEAQIIKLDDGTYKLNINLNFISLEPTSGNGATIFNGIVVVHDENLNSEGGAGQITNTTCAGTQSCLGSYVFNDLAKSPILVPPGSFEARMNATIKLKKVTSNMRIWWFFFQKEAGENLECIFDNSFPNLKDGMQPIIIFNKTENLKTNQQCYGSSDSLILKQI